MLKNNMGSIGYKKNPMLPITGVDLEKGGIGVIPPLPNRVKIYGKYNHPPSAENLFDIAGSGHAPSP